VKRFAFATLCAVLSACSSVPRLTSSPDDYERYREVRLHTTFLGRLGAAWRYLRTQPRGAFRPEVERWFERADERYLVRHWDDVSNLERYTVTLPDAPRSDLARSRIATLQALRQHVENEETAFLEREVERQRELDAAKAARNEFIRILMSWVQAQVTSTDFGKPSTDWNPGFRKAYLEDAAKAICQRDACRKSFLFSFEIPRQDGLETRAASFTLVAHLRGEKLHALELSGPRLFDRIAEAATARPSDPEDLQARAESIGVSAQILTMSLATGFTDPACEREAVSPVVLSRRCGGRAADVIAAEDETQDDRIVVTLDPASN
jgi:hypothetical protein